MAPSAEQLDELKAKMAQSRVQLEQLREKSNRLHLVLQGIAKRVKSAVKIDLLACDWQSKLTDDEAWTLQVLYDFGNVTVAKLEDLLGYSDPRHILYQLGPLERFGLASSRDGQWQLTPVGHRVALFRQQLSRS